MTKTTTIYALPPEPDGPVWDRDGGRWDISPVHGMWCGPGGFRLAWIVLLRDLGPLTNTEPEPVWPTAPLVWHDGKVWVQAASETYFGDSNFWGKYHLNSETTAAREGARRFAREAIPVTIVPTGEWERLRDCVEDEGSIRGAAEALVDATEALNGESND